jgi:hypothetical protein
MGFDDGGFEGVGSTSTSDVFANTAYDFVIDVHTDAMGAYAPGMVTVTLTEEATGIERAAFTGDWSTQPWQPPAGTPVRFGFNGHNADWVVRDLSIAYLD